MTEVDPSLIAVETLDRTSPELWPEPSKKDRTQLLIIELFLFDVR